MRDRGLSFWNILYLGFSFFITKVYYRNARIIRLPFFFRVLGTISLGKNFTAGRSLRVDVHKGGCLEIGSNVQLNDHCQIACAGHLKIGNDVLIASKVFITDHDHDFKCSGVPVDWELRPGSVTIGDECWIGNGVHILKGVTIGIGSIVGAGSVVTKSFEAGSIIAGNPAKLIRSR